MAAILPHSARFFLKGRPRVGADGDARSLMEARRFDEARALIDPADAALRAELAIAQRGPEDALVQAAADEALPRTVRRAARHVLYLDYPLVQVKVPLWEDAKYDSASMVMQLAQRARSQREYAHESALMERLATHFPRADERPGWLWTAAAAAALAGDDARASRLSRELPAAQGLADALEGAETPAPTRHLTTEHDSVAARALDLRDLRDGYMSFRLVSEALAMHMPADVVVQALAPDPAVAAEVLASGGVVVVNVVTKDSGRPVLLPVYALRPDVGVAHVSTDGYLLWSELPWAPAETERMLVYRPGPSVTG